MSDELREEIARALYEHDPGWDPEPWEKTNARMRAAYRVSADAILPIIERVREEVRAAERQSIVHYLLQYGACMADGDTFADEIERKWDMLK